MRRRLSLVPVLAGALMLLGAAPPPMIVDSWVGEPGGRFYEKILVVAITRDRQVRHHFENKFVSHLISRNIQGVTSHSMVPDLDDTEDREEIIRAIEEREITGVIAIRLVPLAKKGEEEWAAHWKESLHPEITVREVIRNTEPVDLEKVKRAGIEVGVWDVGTRKLVWAGRSQSSKRKQLREGGGTFVQIVLNILEDERVIARPVQKKPPDD